MLSPPCVGWEAFFKYPYLPFPMLHGPDYPLAASAPTG